MTTSYCMCCRYLVTFRWMNSHRENGKMASFSHYQRKATFHIVIIGEALHWYQHQKIYFVTYYLKDWKKSIDTWLREKQAGFKAQRWCSDHIFIWQPSERNVFNLNLNYLLILLILKIHLISSISLHSGKLFPDKICEYCKSIIRRFNLC